MLTPPPKNGSVKSLHDDEFLQQLNSASLQNKTSPTMTFPEEINSLAEAICKNLKTISLVAAQMASTTRQLTHSTHALTEGLHGMNKVVRKFKF